MLDQERSASHSSESRWEEDSQGIGLLIGELIDELEKAYRDLLFEADRDERLLRGLAKRDRDIVALKRENDSLKQKIAQINAKPDHSNSEVSELKAELEKLRSMKGYRLQRKFWQLRKAILER